MSEISSGAPDVSRTESDRVYSVFFREGRLAALPVRMKKRLFVLQRFAARFTFGRIYAEKEVNAVISQMFDDYCTIRRELVDYGFMERNSGGYWLLHEGFWIPAIQADQKNEKSG
ncbi:MAG: DUF2087 domain-containing protein [Eubacteriales bacterium]|nr:DUF2087 domain-containing protein [Eubacteriales bacterium]